MMVLWELFVTFLKIGFVSFGGGYSVIPLIQYEVSAKGWLTNGEFQSAVSLAGMAPGPIATNSATLIGYKTAGIAGAVMSTLGIILPSLAVVILLAAFILRLHHRKWMKSSFYGLRPAIAGVIAYAAVHFGFPGGGGKGLLWQAAATLLICAGCLYLILKFKLHPFLIIVAAGCAGIILF